MTAVSAVTTPLSEPPHTRTQPPGNRVLIATAGSPLHRGLGRALEAAGYGILRASTPEEIVAAAAREGPDLVVLELSGRLGAETLCELKGAHGPMLPCVAVADQSRPGDRIPAFEAGADDVVDTTVDTDELLCRLAAALRMRRAYVEAREANEAADRLRLFAAETAALLAHDLNNGLSIASANLNFVCEHVDMDGEVRDALASSQRALRRMTILVRNFVDIARFEDAALVPSRTPVDVNELVKNAAQIHDPRRDGARMEIECPPGLEANLDPVLFERVLHNLLTNATRYVDPGGVVRVNVGCYTGRDGEGRLQLSVGNTGRPIPREIRPTLFEKYRTGPDGRAQRGMGLYFCRLASEALGGSIALEETPDYPTEFVVRIPLSSEHDAA